MICGAEACNLGAMIHGAELRVHFLKSFQKGSTCENAKRAKKQKRRPLRMAFELIFSWTETVDKSVDHRLAFNLFKRLFKRG
jgi:hypothetical protein